MMMDEIPKGPGVDDGDLQPGPLTYVQPQPMMPVEIIRAIIKITGEVKRLGKEGTNTFARYKFTSVDQFYEALGPIMSANGLMDLAEEKSVTIEIREVADERGVVKKSAWMTAIYDFWLYHESGVRFGPITRHIQVQATGAQSYASAQSYAEKYFLRNLFKVPTGDKDEVEETGKEGLPAGPTLINSTQFGDLTGLIKETETELDKFCLTFKIAGLADLPVSRYAEAEDLLKRKLLKKNSTGKAPPKGSYEDRRDPPNA